MANSDDFHGMRNNLNHLSVKDRVGTWYCCSFAFKFSILVDWLGSSFWISKSISSWSWYGSSTTWDFSWVNPSRGSPPSSIDMLVRGGFEVEVRVCDGLLLLVEGFVDDVRTLEDDKLNNFSIVS